MANLQQNNSNGNINYLSDTVCTGLQAPNVNSTATGVTQNSRSRHSSSRAMGLEFSVSGTDISCINQSFAQLKQLESDIELFSKETELALKDEELELTKMQKNLLEIKYDLLKHEYFALEANTLSMHEKLNAYTCSICLSNSKDCILEPCGHFVGCMHCINLLPDNKCPVCRTVCNYYIRVFNS